MSELFRNILETICCGYNPFNNQSPSTITINGHKYEITQLLNEKPLSLTYMVKLQSSILKNNHQDTFVLKQLVCPFGNINNVSDGLREIESYKSFNSKYIIKCVDSQVSQLDDGTKTIYILFPYYTVGSLQDLITLNLLNYENQLTQREIIQLMIGICKGLMCLHDPTTREDMGNLSNGMDSVSISVSHAASSLLDDTPLEMNLLASQNNKLDSFIHLNIKPSTILLDNDHDNDENGYTPIISDLGSCLRNDQELKTDLSVTNLKQWISNRCNIKYMAPDLINIKKNSIIDTSVDIWSLGCLLYTLMYGISPFDREEQINGLPLRHNICKGIYSIPENDNIYSPKLIDIIKSCLQVESIMRPTASELLTQLQNIPL